MDEMAQQWGLNIKGQREARGWTQEELADRLDVTRAAISLWESGDRIPTDHNKTRIAGVFRVAARNLFPLIGTKEPAA